MAVNKYPARCDVCGTTVPANGGRLIKAGRFWRARHLACEDGRPGLIEVRLGSGVTLTRNRRGRCEDAPCCGCCDF